MQIIDFAARETPDFPAGSRCVMNDKGYGVCGDIEGVMDDGRVIVRVTHTGHRPGTTLRVGDLLGVPFNRITGWTC